VESFTYIERYEFKYLLPERRVPAVRAAIKPLCVLDRHAGPNGRYTIRSHYLDTDRFDLFFANEREQRDRFKARIRSYPGAAAPVFLEIKRRVGDVILKSRAALAADVWQRVVESPTEAARTGRAGAIQFVDRVHRYQLRPRMMVEYDREAYESTIDSYARVTFDRRIVCQVKETLGNEVDGRRWRHVDHPAQTNTAENVCVLELKFERRPPRWMVHMVQSLDLVRLSFSKYCYGVASQLLFPVLRTSSLRGGWADV
jgi:SPX domain protein involved in polyphosphate accumulation